MELAKAKAIADRVRVDLAPHCDRIEIAGSIRRQKPDVGDIELVAIPKMSIVQGSLFKDQEYPMTDQEFCRLVDRWPSTRGVPTGRYTQRKLPDGIMLDLFMCDRKNWGLIFAIRTGSARWSYQVLAAGWVKAGYHSDDGRLRLVTPNGLGKMIDVLEERDLFERIDLSWVEPKDRG